MASARHSATPRWCSLALKSSHNQGCEYGQDRLRIHAALVREWCDAGAAFYVCGSLQGMASGMQQALTEILGNECVAQPAATGRYRRDVY